MTFETMAQRLFMLLVSIGSLVLITGCTGVIDIADRDADGSTMDASGGDATPDSTNGDMSCTPDCAGRDCGDDGCGGTCGSCPGGESCNVVSGECASGPGCGDGIVQSGETCDGDCPTTCTPSSACETATLYGSAAMCTAECIRNPITICGPADGCCPDGCNASLDDDCGAECGNGVVEGDELCDGDCPTSCANEGCTMRTMVGSAATCDARCQETTQTTCQNGDGCCPDGCSPTDDDDCIIDCRDANSWPAAWAAAEEAALAQMNLERQNGRDCASGPNDPVTTELVMDPAMREAARCHSLDMASNNFFSHDGSDGSSFGQRLNEAGWSGWPLGENIAAGNGGGEQAVEQWMTSTAGHCDHVMNPDATKVGIGYAYERNSDWGHYWTAVFGR